MASTGPRPRTAPWLARFVAWLLGLAVGMGSNLVSADIGYRGVAIVFAVGAILMAAWWLRGFRPDFVLVVWVVRGFLLIAVAAVVVATMADTAAAGLAVLVAALATLGATVIRSDPEDRLVFLGAVALIGTGAAFLAEGISSAELTGEGRFYMIAVGGFIALFGVATMSQDRAVFGLVKLLVADALTDKVPIFHMVAGFFAVMGVLAAVRGAVLPAVVMGMIAIGASGMRVGHTRGRPEVVGPAAMLIGVAWALMGTWGVTGGEVLLGAAAAGLGLTIIVAGFTYLSRRGVLTRVRSWLDAAKKDS